MTAVHLHTGFSKYEDVKFTGEDFKKEWTRIETEGVKTILDMVLEKNFDKSLDANFFFQLVYTSSSRFTGLNVCDSRIYIEGYNLMAFLIRNNNQLIAHCFDEDENDVFFEVE